MNVVSGAFDCSPLGLPLAYRCHKSAAGSAAGVRPTEFWCAACVETPCACEEEPGQDGEELFARFRFLRFGVSSSEELFGIQPICSSGERSTSSSFLTSSQSPIRSSNGNRAPGVHGNEFDCSSFGVLCILLPFLDPLPLPCSLFAASVFCSFGSDAAKENAFSFVFASTVAGIAAFGGIFAGASSSGVRSCCPRFQQPCRCSMRRQSPAIRSRARDVVVCLPSRDLSQKSQWWHEPWRGLSMYSRDSRCASLERFKMQMVGGDMDGGRVVDAECGANASKDATRFSA